MKNKKPSILVMQRIVQMSLSPSPQPSPSGRGRISGRVSPSSTRPVCSKDRRRGSLSPGERAGVRGNRAPDHRWLRTCRILLVVSLTLGSLATQAASSPVAAPDGWQTLSPRDELRPEFSYNPKGGPSGTGAFVIRTGKLEGLDGHWARTYPVKGGQF